jgi:hypothetical protein
MWKIGTVASVIEGWGFNITDERGRPLVAFAYETHGEAAVAARHVEAAVKPSRSIRCRGMKPKPPRYADDARQHAPAWGAAACRLLPQPVMPT